MLEHHIQKAIVYKLAFAPSLRFSKLKPDELDNKLFSYHLKQVVNSGLVKKDGEGSYSLTAEGRRVGAGVLDKQAATLARAHSVLFLIVRRKNDKAWLMFKRKTHPLFGGVGLMHVNPKAGENVFKTAKNKLLTKTNLNAKFKYLGSGYFTFYKDGELESFTHFTVLSAEDSTGEFKSKSDKGEYFWVADLSEIKKELLPTADAILQQYQSGKQFFIEQVFNS